MAEHKVESENFLAAVTEVIKAAAEDDTIVVADEKQAHMAKIVAQRWRKKVQIQVVPD